MNSPNLLAASAAQRTTRLRLLIYGNLLPLHDPLRLAEELAMLDCLSGGRIVSGFARGIPREHKVYNVPLRRLARPLRGGVGDHLPRVDGGGLLLRGQVLVVRGRRHLAATGAAAPPPGVGARVREQGDHRVGGAATTSRSRRALVPTRGLREDMIRYYAQCLAQHGHRLTPDHLIIQTNAYVADSKAQAVKEAGPYLLYFNRTLFSHGNITEASLQKEAGYLSSSSFDYVRPENLPAVSGARERYRDMTMDDVARDAEHLPWGAPAEVRERIIAAADHAGAGTVLVGLNRGAMPQDMFLEQVRRFGAEVLPALQKHRVNAVPYGS